MGFKGDLMSKTKASTIFAFFLFTILFTILFALLSACGGGGDKKNDSDSGSSNPDKSVEEPAPPPAPPAPPASFRSTWRVPVDDKDITLPLVENYNYNFTVDWGDGSPISEITEHGDMDKTHTYKTEGDYNLVIEGTLEAWSFNNDSTGDKDKILFVEDFGDLGYKNLSGAFHGCANLRDFEGGVTSAVTDMANMFNGATSADPDVSEWDVSKVTDMNLMFNGATSADPDVSEWDFSSVTNMTSMFDDSGLSTANYDAFLINLANNNVNVSVADVTLGATGIYYYSDDAKTARDTLKSDRGWTITDAGDAAIFRSTWRTTTANETITLPLVDDGSTYNFTVDWGDESPISTITSFDDMDKTHNYTTAEDHNLVIEGTLETWSFNNTGDKDKILSVESFGDLGYKNLSGAFHGCANLRDFEGGVTSAVTSMTSMFLFASNVNPDVSDWDVSAVTRMNSMFSGATNANPDVKDWDVSSVLNMGNLFQSATSADPDVSDWDVSSVISVNGMFQGATNANPDVSNWNVSSVIDMRSMFFSATNANPDVSSWNVSSVTSMASMFGHSGLSTANYDAFLINLANNNVNGSVADVTLGATGIYYTSDAAKTARDTLINDRGWMITDAGEAATP